MTAHPDGTAGRIFRTLGGGAAVVRSRHQRVVLAACALRAGWPVALVELCEALWGLDVLPSAPGTLRSLVSSARAASDRTAV